MKSSFPKLVATPLTAKSLSERLGNYISITGNTDNIIQSVSSPQNADVNSLIFCNKENNDEIYNVIKDTKATVVIVSASVKVNMEKCMIVVNEPLEWFINALNILFDFKHIGFIHSNSTISNNVSIGKNVSIGSGTFVEKGCIIENGCIIGTNCYIGPGTILGKNVLIQNNSSIGGVGLGYHVNEKKERLFFPHLGVVSIGDDVVIGSNCVIVRGELKDTTIGDRSRIGNLVNIGHNVDVGCDCSVSSSTCIAGGTLMGDECNIAAGVKINAKIKIGYRCQVGLGSVVVRDVPDRVSVFGNPAKPLPTMRKF